MENEIIGIKIKTFRLALNMSQEIFGEKVGMKQPQLALLEQGKRKQLKMDVVSNLIKLGINQNWLFNSKSEDNPCLKHESLNYAIIFTVTASIRSRTKHLTINNEPINPAIIAPINFELKEERKAG